MTIAAGFQCTDGILLAADTLYSGVNKRYDRKVWMLPTAHDVAVVIAGAGEGVLIRRVRDDIQRALKRLAKDATQEAVRDIIDGALFALFIKTRAKPKTYAYEDNPDAFPLYLLVGVRTDEGCRLYESGGNAVVATVDKCATCIGWGAALGLYITDSVYTRRMPEKWARIVAAHLVRVAKTYADSCGGDTHLLFLPTAGVPIFTHDKQEIARLETYLGQLDEALRVVLPGGKFEASDFTLEHRLQEIVKAIEGVRNIQAAIGLSGAQATVQGYAPEPLIGPTPKAEQ